MIAHLSSDQLSECVVGQANPAASQHLDACPACRAELANFRETLADFRSAVHAWSQDQANAALVSAPATEPQSWTPSQQLAWALLIAAISIIASFVIPHDSAGRAQASDVVLLNQVDSEVSRTVPSSMEPLMKLVVQNQ